jgi:ribosomal-protein-alanine N-acetyltransferase
MTVRKMVQADVPAVAAIEQACFSEPWTEKGFLDALDNPHAIFWVAEEDTKILGYLGMYVSVDEGEITNVAIGEPFRGRGIGRTLLETAQSYAAERPLMRIILEVRVGNIPAITLYRRCGFVGLGIRRDFYELPKEDAEIMMWTYPESCTATEHCADG